MKVWNPVTEKQEKNIEGGIKMKSEQQIKEKLNDLAATYRFSSDMYNPVLQARIKDLKWVLET